MSTLRPSFLSSERISFSTWQADDLPLASALWGDPERAFWSPRLGQDAATAILHYGFRSLGIKTTQLMEPCYLLERAESQDTPTGEPEIRSAWDVPRGTSWHAISGTSPRLTATQIVSL